MKNVFIVIVLLLISLSTFAQKIDTLIVFAGDTQYYDIAEIRDLHGGRFSYAVMNPAAPNAYYRVYKRNFLDSTKIYLLREGLFLNGHKEGEWIEYRSNGKKFCIELWDAAGSTGYKKFFTKTDELRKYMRWEDGKIVEDVCYRECE